MRNCDIELCGEREKSFACISTRSHWWKKAIYSVAHQVFCPYGLAVLAAVLTFEIVGMLHGTARTAHLILTETPFYPVQIATGLVGGFCVGKYFSWPLTRWTWVLPATLLVFALLFVSAPVGISRIDYWFGWSGMPGRVFPPLQTAVTMPLYLSLAYSVSAFLGARLRPRRD